MNQKPHFYRVLHQAVFLFIMVCTSPIHAGSISYLYDELNRVTEVSYGNGSTITYTYDAAGNRISSVGTSQFAEPSIISQPQNQTATIRDGTTFHANADGTSLRYQWQLSTNEGVSWSNIPEATSSSYTFWNVTKSMNGNLFRVRVSNSGGTMISNAAVLSVSFGYTVNDFDGDGITDIYFYHQETGQWSIIQSSDMMVVTRNWGGPGLVPVHGDYNGNGLGDLALYQPSTGAWFIRELEEGRPPITFGQVWGGPGMVPVPGDYNGDGKFDLAVYQRGTGNWFIMSLGPIGPSNPPITFGQNWGSVRMEPVSGDYNGDGIHDLAAYDFVDGTWYIRSLGPLGPANPPITFGQQWGGADMRPVSADFNGNGSHDLAVVQNDTHNWFIRQLGPDGPNNPPITFGNQWGYGATQPRLGDYNGDGLTDLAIYDPIGARWFVKTLNEVALYFGLEFGIPMQ